MAMNTGITLFNRHTQRSSHPSSLDELMNTINSLIQFAGSLHLDLLIPDRANREMIFRSILQLTKQSNDIDVVYTDDIDSEIIQGALWGGLAGIGVSSAIVGVVAVLESTCPMAVLGSSVVLSGVSFPVLGILGGVVILGVLVGVGVKAYLASKKVAYIRLAREDPNILIDVGQQA
eukprot:TRINITY_DN9745_c0_g1_i1.p1 TRINITY_DN9745_c0_g1~~TRINITY_DN9745_c0_g1_i1.p1  ORF type:complete len:188 (-),score=17.79 TRINITY_DN9745_c0_g1_i1:59-586(-)